MTDKARLIALSTPVVIRANKQVGGFATDTIELSNPDSLKAYGRGKKLTIGLVNITTGLVGTIGQSKSNWTHLVGVVLESQHTRLPKGLLITMVLGGLESKKVEKLNQDIELDLLMGIENKYKLVIEFGNSIKTQYGTTIYPPSILMEELEKEDYYLIDEGYEWVVANTQLVDPLVQYPTLGHVIDVNQIPPSA